MTKLNSQTRMTKAISRKMTISNLECKELTAPLTHREKMSQPTFE